MRTRIARLGLAALLLSPLGCRKTGPSSGGEAPQAVAGRWQRVDQPADWIEFGRDGSFRSRSFTGTQVAGRYTQTGSTVKMTVVPEGHGATMTLSDTLLVMEEGTRYRRARP